MIVYDLKNNTYTDIKEQTSILGVVYSNGTGNGGGGYRGTGGEYILTDGLNSKEMMTGSVTQNHINGNGPILNMYKEYGEGTGRGVSTGKEEDIATGGDEGTNCY